MQSDGQRVPCFIELCCGSAAATLRLIGGANARPAISYQGAKTGYATAILNVLGLRSGQGADAVVLCDAGPWAKAWRLLTTPEGCNAVASVIRGWIGEDARALWDRLRAEPVADGWAARDVAAWLWLEGVSHPVSDSFFGELASHGQRRGDHGWGADESGRAMIPRGGERATLAARVGRALSWPPTIVSNADVSTVEPGTLPEGAVCLIDPPYKGDGTKKITGYAHDLSRAAVVEVALKWAAAGASVAVCESVALPELLELGWYSVEITDCRVGQKRTFSRCKSEWLTLSRPPAWTPERQCDLFATK